MRKGLVAVCLLASASILLAVPGCQGSNGVEPAVDAADRPDYAALLPDVEQLPALTAKREPAYSEYDLLSYGKYFYSAGFNQNVVASGNFAQFSPSFGDTHGRTLNNLAYCMYLFYIDSVYTDEQEINYGWDLAPAHLSTAWIGVSDHNHEIWRWYQCNPAGHQDVDDLDLCFSSTGQVLNVVFVLAGEDPARLAYVRVGAPSTQAHIHTSPTNSFPPLDATFDASGSTTGIGDIVKYEWDWNNDGIFELDTGDTPTADHSYSAIGTHHPAVRVTSEYGEQDSASMDVKVCAQWTHSWGTDRLEAINGVCTDAELGCYGVGWMNTAEDMKQLLLLKWDLAGNLEWARAWGGASDEEGCDIVATAGVLYVLGSTESYGAGARDILLQKWNSDGDLVWSRTWGGNSFDEAQRFSLRDEYLYLAGETRSFAHGNGDALVLRFNTAGDLVWARSVGDSAPDSAWGIRAFKAFATQTTSVHVAGHSESYKSAGSAGDALYLRFSTDGTLTKAMTWNGGENQTGMAVCVSGLSGDEIYVGGHNNSDLLLLEVGTGGGLTAAAWDSGEGDLCHDMERLGASLLLCGQTGASGSEEDAVVLNLSPGGAVQGAQAWDLAGEDESWLGIAGHPAGVLLGGKCVKADGGSWGNASGTVSTISGSWTTRSITPDTPAGQVGAPSADAVDVTSLGVIDAGGGDPLDALMSVRTVP